MEIEHTEGRLDEQKKAAHRAQITSRRIWWLLPVAVLLLLLVVIYVLGHISSADSEMYPTTRLHSIASLRHC
jgi:ABC-type spermidine/putrescine transport system permease subunit I